MIHITSATSGTKIYIPCNKGKDAGNNYTLTLASEEYGFVANWSVEDTGNTNDYFVCVVDFSAVKDGEYTYNLDNGNGNWANGLIRFGGQKQGVFEYDVTPTYYEYDPETGESQVIGGLHTIDLDVEYIGNGHYTINTPDNYDGIGKVEVDVNVDNRQIPDIDKVDNYLYEVTYSRPDYEKALEYFLTYAPSGISDCTAVRSGDFVGRNFDWYDGYRATFAVHTPAYGDFKRVFGTAAMNNLTNQVVESGHWVDEYEILPFMLMDGFNDGLFMEMNVVPSWNNTQTVPQIEKRDRVSALMLIRYCLDRFESVDEAIEYLQNYVAIYMPQNLEDMGYELHFLLADSANTKVIEFVDNEIKVIDTNKSTNFHLYGVTPDEDGKVYTNVDAKDGRFATSQGVESAGTGLERYNTIADFSASTAAEMAIKMDSLNYSQAYTLPTDENFWYSEFVGGNISVDTLYDDPDFQTRIQEYKEKWAAHVKGDGTVWHTEHSVVYDLNEKAVYVSVEEEERRYAFRLHNGGDECNVQEKDVMGTIEDMHIYPDVGFDCMAGVSVDMSDVRAIIEEPYQRGYISGHTDGYAEGYGSGYTKGHSDGYAEGYSEGVAESFDVGYASGHTDGFIEGEAAQKAKLAATAYTQNGTYTREDGWNTVVVAIDYEDIFQRGYVSGHTDGYAEGYGSGLTEGYTNGYTDGYNAGRIAGIAEQKAKLTSTAITQNGNYTREDGWNNIIVNIDIDTPRQEGYESGHTAGEADQKAKLTAATFTSNNTYTRENGWNRVVVNVDTESYYNSGYTAGENAGIEEGRAERDAMLTGIDITENGSYVAPYGYSSITVDVADISKYDIQSLNATGNGTYHPVVPAGKVDAFYSAVTVNVDTEAYYNSGYTSGYTDGWTTGYTSGHTDGYEDGYTIGHTNGYSEGKAAQKSLLVSTAITQNGNYTRENGWNALMIDVADISKYDIQTISITENGTYRPTAAIGKIDSFYSSVTVNVQPRLESKNIILDNPGSTTISPESGYYGIGEVIVDASNVYSSGYTSGYTNGFIEGSASGVSGEDNRVYFMCDGDPTNYFARYYVDWEVAHYSVYGIGNFHYIGTVYDINTHRGYIMFDKPVVVIPVSAFNPSTYSIQFSLVDFPKTVNKMNQAMFWRQTTKLFFNSMQPPYIQFEDDLELGPSYSSFMNLSTGGTIYIPHNATANYNKWTDSAIRYNLGTSGEGCKNWTIEEYY